MDDLIVKVKKYKKNKLFKYYVKMDYKIFQAGKWEVTDPAVVACGLRLS